MHLCHSDTAHTSCRTENIHDANDNHFAQQFVEPIARQEYPDSLSLRSTSHDLSHDQDHTVTERSL